jgi:dsDNA-binding SOS-regulon protein
MIRRGEQMEIEIGVKNILRKMQENLAKRGIKISEDRLMETISKFIAENEEELMTAIKREKSDEILKRWLETPIKVEETDALEEHDSVI